MGARTLHHRRIKSGEQRRRPAGKAVKLGLGLWPGKGAHGGPAGLFVRQKVKGRSVGPPVACQNRQRLQGQMRLKAGAGGRKEVIEHRLQGQHRRPRVHRPRDRGQGAHLAPRRAFFHQRHVEPGMGKPQGGGQTAHARPDHHHPVHM